LAAIAVFAVMTSQALALTELRTTVAPREEGGELQVWARDFERSGLARVTFDAQTQTLQFTRGNVSLEMPLESPTARLNGVPVRVPAPARGIAGRAMVPARFVLGALGLGRATVVPAQGIPESQRTAATISGRALYAGEPQAGIALRLVRADDFSFVPDLRARTDPEGRYLFGHVREGEYRVYAYVGDNPGYFNRVTARLEVKGRAVNAPDINLGRILEPEDPPRRAILSPAADIVFIWSPCSRAAQYHLSVIDSATSEEVFSGVTPAPHALVDLSRMRPGHRYEWRVTATDTAGAFLGASPGPGAEPWTFTVGINQGDAERRP
jgi:hypothetical protein